MKKVFGVLAILLVAGLVMMGCASPTNSNSTVGDPSFRSLSDGVIDSWNSVKGNTGTGGDQPIGDNNPNEKNRTGSWFTYLTFGTGYIVTPVWEWVKDGEYPSDNPQYSGSDSATGYGTDKDGNGGTINNGSNSWFMYNKYNGTAYNTQIVAGNPKNKINVVGTLNFSAPVDGKVTVSINLNDNVKSSDGVYQFWAGKSDLMPPKSPGQFNKDTDPRCIGGYSGANTQWTFAYPGNTVNIAVHLSVTYLVSAGGGGGGEYGHWVQTGEKITGNY
ncbi:MAG: hypothetical protein FWC45_05495, partial [Treponema sp.]|nr:hypothetical protein [Treponema sp.]